MLVLLSTHLILAQSFKIAVISDLHYLSSDLVEDGQAYKCFVEQIGREVSEMHTVFDQVLCKLLYLKPDVVFIPGDLTNHGELKSHYAVINKLQVLLDNGIHVYVIPGNHDVNIPDSKAYMFNGVVATEGITPSEFEKLYGAYGYSTAKERDDVSLSYLAELNDSVWLLAIDTNRYEEHRDRSITAGRIKEETMDWSFRILEKAKEQDVLVLAMMHHGLVEHFPYQSLFFADYLVADWYNKASKLADAGLQIVFTGHFHANDVTEFKTDLGNKIYDIETGSLAHYPFPFRFLELEEKELNVRSYFIDKIPDNRDFRAKHKINLEQKARKLITAKLNEMSFLKRSDFIEALTDILTKISMMHVEGDEYVDLEMFAMIKLWISILGGDITDMNELIFDFPPADNNLKIVLQ